VSDLNKPSIKITFSRLPKIEILENGDSIAIINIDYTFDGVKLNNGFFGALKNQKETNVQIQPLALTTIETNGKKVIWNLNSGIYRFIQSTFSGREIIYRTAFNIIKEKPYVGYGPGVWSEIYSIHKPVGNIVEGFAHLDLIQYIVGYGFPITIISFLILCIVTTTAILKVEYNKLKEVCYLIGIGLIIAILHSFVDYPLQVYSIQLLFVFLLANLMSISELDKQKAKVI
jgi:O-antigen ligase